MTLDIRSYNRSAWDRQVAKGNRWTLPVGPDEIARARQGDIAIVLTPEKSIPREWLGDVRGRKLLCLAGGGGQQASLLAAAGAEVTLLDNSPSQLAQDRLVAEREGLSIELVEGDMRDLSAFGDGHFELIVNPCSTCFIPDLLPMWRECYRVLAPGGELMTGFLKPEFFLFDWDAYKKGELVVRYPTPYSDTESLSAEERQALIDADEPLCFGHSYETQISGQLQAGFVLTGLYEDRYAEKDKDAMSKYTAPYLATRAKKL